MAKKPKEDQQPKDDLPETDEKQPSHTLKRSEDQDGHDRLRKAE